MKELDPANPKALFRRAIGFKSQSKYEEAVRDLQALHKQDPSKKDIKQELDDCMKLLIDSQKAKKANETKANEPKSKIQEVSSAPVSEEKQEEKEEPSHVKKQASIKTKILDQETIQKAVEITNGQINKKLLKSVPKTAAGFEADYNSLKKDLPTFYAYVKVRKFSLINIPLEYSLCNY